MHNLNYNSNTDRYSFVSANKPAWLVSIPFQSISMSPPIEVRLSRPVKLVKTLRLSSI